MKIRCLNCMKEYDESFGVCPDCGYAPGQPAKEPFELPPGVVLADKYLVGTEVGVGGFGITYRAWDQTLQQEVALKEYYPSANGIVNRNPGEEKVIIYGGQRAVEFEKGRQRFLSEARNMARFSTHPNIVHVHDFFEANGTAYIVMEFLKGISYKDFIRQSENGRIDCDTAVQVTLAVLDALKEIHSAGIIHRDVSPDNVFILDNGVIKLIDFGAARFSTGEEEKELSIILKPGYAPPEQYQSKSRQGPWTDIYAVGAMLYRAITGRMPDESVNRQVKDELVSPKELYPEIPENISNAVMRAMAVNQDLRFRTVDQFRDALKSTGTVLDDKEELKRRKKNRITVIAAVFALLLTVGGITGFRAVRSYRAEHLNPVSISLWYPVSGEADGEDMEPLLQDYRERYRQVDVQVTGIPEESYAETLKEALESGSGPDVFDSTCLENGEMDQFLGSVDDPIGFLTDRSWAGDYYFLEDYDRYFPAHDRLPLSFQLPILYSDTVLAEEVPALSEAEDLETLVSDNQDSVAVSPDDLWLYEDLLPGFSSSRKYEDFVVRVEVKEEEQTKELSLQEEEAEREKQFRGKAAYYLSDTSEYAKIQNDMPGIYRVTLLQNMPIRGYFSHVWSVSAAGTEDQHKAAVRLLYYLLSEENQQTVNIRRKGGLPLHKKAFRDFESLNTELQGIEDCLGGLQAGGN